jgi:hypothetical protein
VFGPLTVLQVAGAGVRPPHPFPLVFYRLMHQACRPDALVSWWQRRKSPGSRHHTIVIFRRDGPTAVITRLRDRRNIGSLNVYGSRFAGAVRQVGANDDQ